MDQNNNNNNTPQPTLGNTTPPFPSEAKTGISLSDLVLSRVLRGKEFQRLSEVARRTREKFIKTPTTSEV